MMHYKGVWSPLPTQRRDHRDGYFYYSAQADSFSPFAITGRKMEKTSLAIPSVSGTQPISGKRDKTEMQPLASDIPEKDLSWILMIGVLTGILANSILILKIKNKWSS